MIMHFRLLFLGLIIQASSNIIYAWVPDESCSSGSETIIDSMTSAFSMADTIDKALTQDPLNSDVQDLASKMLGNDNSKYLNVQSKWHWLQFSRNLHNSLTVRLERARNLDQIKEKTNIQPGTAGIVRQ